MYSVAKSAITAAGVVITPWRPFLYHIWAAKEIVDLITEVRVIKPNLKAGFSVNRKKSRHGYWQGCGRRPLLLPHTCAGMSHLTAGELCRKRSHKADSSTPRRHVQTGRTRSKRLEKPDEKQRPIQHHHPQQLQGRQVRRMERDGELQPHGSGSALSACEPGVSGNRGAQTEEQELKPSAPPAPAWRSPRASQHQKYPKARLNPSRPRGGFSPRSRRLRAPCSEFA